MRKVWEVISFLTLLGVPVVLLATYAYFTVPKFRTGDCVRLDYGTRKVYTITEVRKFRYILNNRLNFKIEFLDNNARKVSCK